MWRKSMAYNWKKNRNMVVVLKKNYIEYLLDILLYGSLEERKALALFIFRLMT